jgi:hypothetical protein
LPHLLEVIRCSDPRAIQAALDADGVVLVPELIARSDVLDMEKELGATPAAGAGTRGLLAFEWCRELTSRLRDSVIRGVMDEPCVAIQCTLFDKTPEHNWLVAPHQDLSVPVASVVDHPELRNWTRKEGTDFVQPPEELLERLVALRLHVDECGEDNGPLRVVPGSHRHGRIPETERLAVRDAIGEVPCTARAGDALLLKPLILHASSKASAPRRRRVLHFLFGPQSPGYGLRWAQAT